MLGLSSLFSPRHSVGPVYRVRLGCEQLGERVVPNAATAEPPTNPPPGAATSGCSEGRPHSAAARAARASAHSHRVLKEPGGR